MNWAGLLLAGAVIGLMMAVPVGPVNLFAISRTLRYGFLAGLVAGLGGMAADTMLATIAAFGVTWVIDFVEGNARPIQLGCGVLLIIMGIAASRSRPHLDGVGKVPSTRSVWRGGLTAFFMTVTNPGAAIAMLALFGSLGNIEDVELGGFASLVVVAGVAAGSTVWWFLLATMVGRLRDKLSDEWLHRINLAAGVVLLACGFGLIGGLLLGIELV